MPSPDDNYPNLYLRLFLKSPRVLLLFCQARTAPTLLNLLFSCKLNATFQFYGSYFHKQDYKFSFKSMPFYLVFLIIKLEHLAIVLLSTQVLKSTKRFLVVKKLHINN